MTVVIAGASGFMGTALAAAFGAAGEQVRTIGRTGSDAVWGEDLAPVLSGADLLVNLAGRSVNCRYAARNREVILHSRVKTTTALLDAVQRAEAPPSLWINSSTATIYRHAEDRPQTESTGELGEGFSVDVARAWEDAFFAGELPATRRVALRTAIVLGDGSVLTPLRLLTRLGLGGAHLDGRWPATRSRLAAGTYHRFGARGGRQRFSWIHLDDVHGIIQFLRGRPDLDGIFNAASPNPVDDRTFMSALRDALGVPFGLPQPRWLLELGAIGIRTETELVLKSRWVVPERLLAEGYSFRYPELEPALRAILNSR